MGQFSSLRTRRVAAAPPPRSRAIPRRHRRTHTTSNCVRHFQEFLPGLLHTMALPDHSRGPSCDSSAMGMYRASPAKLMLYGNGQAFLWHTRITTDVVSRYDWSA